MRFRHLVRLRLVLIFSLSLLASCGGGDGGVGGPPLDTTASNAPILFGTTPTNDTTPTWSWISRGGGGTGTFRYKLDDSDLSTGAIETINTSYTPSEPLPDGTHSFYVQESVDAGNWSMSGSFAITIDTAPPNAPTVTGDSPTNDTTPTWSWTSGGGGNGIYRYKLDDSDFSTGATETTRTSFTQSQALSDGTYVLYVQERDAAANWSVSGSKELEIDTGPVGDAKNGEVFFILNNCVGCHSANGSGNPAIGAPDIRFNTEAEIKIATSTGPGIMPVFNLTDLVIADIAVWLTTQR